MTETEQAADSAEQVTEVLKQLQRQLLDLALEIVNEMEESIADAPLNQQVAALKAILDSVLKLEERMPRDEKEGSVIRLEYIDPDGSIHQTPPWARGDSHEHETIHRRRLWTEIRKDRVGEDQHS
jgi:hypothetical protein